MAQGTNDCSYIAKKAATLNNPTSASVFVQSDNSAKSAYVRIPVDSASLGSDPGKSLLFQARAFGYVTTGTTSNFLAKLQFTKDVTATASGTTSATAANNTDVITLTNRSLASVTRSWFISGNFMWDFVSKRLTGQWNGVNGETIETASQVVTAVTSVDLSTGVCGLTCAALFGSTNAGNNAFMTSFELEVL